MARGVLPSALVKLRLALALLCLLQLSSSAEAGTRALLVLGTRVSPDGTPSPKLRGRLEKARQLALADPTTHVIVSGGAPNGPTEAPVMARWLAARGVDPSRILIEPHARHTGQNADFALPFLERVDAEQVTVVTDASHLPRALFHVRAAAREQGRTLRVDGAASPDGLSRWQRLRNRVVEPFKIARDLKLRRDALGERRRTERALGTVVEQAIEQRLFPGAALVVGRGEVTLVRRAFGKHAYGPSAAVTTRSRFDVASLTKVVATTTAAMKLFEAGRLDLDAPLSRYLPEYRDTDKAGVTVRQILTHTAGFGGLPREGRAQDRAGLLEQVRRQPLEEPGTERYSDLGFIVLGQLIERISGQRLDAFTRQAVFQPLGMHDTGFRPNGSPVERSIVPTGAPGALPGEVHDGKARALGGVAGHAGLFSTAEDLERFARMLASGGRLDGKRFLAPATIAAFLGPDAGGRRALGWDRNRDRRAASAGSRFGPNSFGHTGFTGTSLWIDPDRGAFAILLSNRVYPGGTAATIDPVRATVADLAHTLAAP